MSPANKGRKNYKKSSNKKTVNVRHKRSDAKSSKKEVLHGQLALEVWGIALIALATLFIFALVKTSPTSSNGILTLIAQGFLVQAFGKAAFVVPLVLLYSGVLMLLRKSHYLVVVRIFGLFLIILTSCIAAELIQFGATALSGTFNEYVLGVLGQGGGVVGAAAVWALSNLVGVFGTVVIGIAFMLWGLVITTNVPVVVALKGFFKGLKAIFVFVSSLFAGKEKTSLRSDRTNQKKSLRPIMDSSSVSFGKAGDDTDIPSYYRTMSEDVNQPAINTDEKQVITYGIENRVGEHKSPSLHIEHNKQEGEKRKKSTSQKETPSASFEDMNNDHKEEQLKLLDDSVKNVLPPVSLLKPIDKKVAFDNSNTEELSRMLEATLQSFGVSAKVVDVSKGPMVTRYELHPGVGVKVSKILNLADDLALAFAAPGVRIEAPIPGKAAIGIEVPNKVKNMVYFREMLESKEFQNSKSKLTIALGKDISGKPIVAVLADMLHLLVAGSTGSGKSVCLNSIICSLIFNATPDEVQLFMIDPKRVELSIYDGIPHMGKNSVITEPKKAAGCLNGVVSEMERRYKLFQFSGVRNIGQYNEMIKTGAMDQFIEDESIPEDKRNIERKPLPYIVVILDELADLMMVAANEIEAAICRLAFMARAAGIHLILATQRPSADVVTGIIKANIPSRIAFAVASQIDSRIILDSSGAERLLGKGDMLFHPIGMPKPLRVQGAFITDKEIADVVGFLKQQDAPDYEIKYVSAPTNDKAEGLSEEDEYFIEAARLVVESGEASISKIQRRFRVGYARAARLIDTMEILGIIGPSEGSKPRKVLISSMQLEEMISANENEDEE